MSERLHIRKNTLLNSGSTLTNSSTQNHTPDSGLSVVNQLPLPAVVQAKLDLNLHQTQQEMENQTFQQEKLEATKLEIQAKHSTLTPEDTKRLSVLQAKMNGWVQTRLEDASRFGHNLSNISVKRPDIPPSQHALQTKLAIGQPSDKFEQEADRTAAYVMSMPATVLPVQQQSLTEEEESVQTKPIPISTVDSASVQQKCSECEREERVQRSEDGKAASSNIENQLNSSKGGGSPLSDEVRSFMEPRFGADFSGVRVHTGSAAMQMNQELGAQAFTYGSDIYYGSGKAPENNDLTAHELTHVVQQAFADKQVQRLCGVDESCPEETMNMSDRSSSAGMTSADAPMSVTAPETSYTTDRDDSSVEAQVASFKRLVLTTARAKLASNRVNLEQWRNAVERLQLDRQQQLALQVAQLQETVERRDGVGQSSLEQYLTERNPIRREIRLHQTEGRYTACTGCHAEQWATRLENETPSFMQTGSDWQPVADRLTGVESRDRQYLEPWLAAYPMPNQLGSESQASSEEEVIRQWLAQSSGESSTARDSTASTATSRSSSAGREHEGIPNSDLQQSSEQDRMERINAITESYRVIIEALGSEGYKVWPASAITWDSENIEGVRQSILSQIDQRQSDYLELMTMIANGEREYIEFTPILQELLITTSPAVREVIQAEIDAEQAQNLLEAIVVGAATLALLLLTIFPPSTAIGVAGLAVLEVGLGAHAIVSGVENIEQGYAYSLAEGTEGIYSHDQIQGSGSMLFGGFISVVTGPLMIGVGSLRGIGAGMRMVEGGALAEINASEAISEGASAVFGSRATTLGPRTIRQGQLILSYEADGTVVATVEGNPNIMMIAREGEAIMYERTTDGLRIVQRAPLETASSGGSVAGSEAISEVRELASSGELVSETGTTGGGITNVIEGASGSGGSSIRGGVRLTTLTGDQVIVDSNIARAMDKASQGLPLQPGEQLMVEYAQQQGIVVTDRTVAELAARHGVQGTLNVGQEVVTTQAERQAIMDVLEGAGVGGGVADRQIVQQAILTQTTGSTAPTLATADRGIINGLARIAGIRPDRLGRYRTIAEFLQYERGSNTFEVVIEGRRLIVRPVQAVRGGL